MATFNGVNYARRYINNGKYDIGEYNGHSKHLYDDFTFAAEMTAADIIRIGKLPKGARVIAATMKAPALGAGSFSLGHLGYPVAADGTSYVAKSAASAGFIAATSFAAANQVSGVGVDIGFKFQAESEVQATCTVTTTVATGLKIQTWVGYVVE